MFINVSLDHIQILLFSALSGISVFMFLYSILDIGIGRKKLSNKLLDIKFMFSPEYHDLKKGSKFLQSGRFFVANNVTFLNLDRLKKNLRISKLDKYITEFDVVFIKIVTYTMFILSLLVLMGEGIKDPIQYMSTHVLFMIYFIAAMYVLYYWDKHLVQLFDSLRIKHYYGQFGQFIIIFASCIHAGDNAYIALNETIPTLKGEFKKNVDECVKSYKRVGRADALAKLKKDVNLDVMDFFVSVIEDNDNSNNGLYEYLEKNLKDFVNQLYYIKKNNSDGRLRILNLSNVFGLISFFLLVSTLIFVLNRAVQEFI